MKFLPIALTAFVLSIFSTDFEKLWREDFSQLTELKFFTPYPSEKPHYHMGDFFGDGQLDHVFKATDSTGRVCIVFVNEGKERSIVFLGGDRDPFGITDYEWAEDFRKVAAGQVLWSNFTEERRSFEEVPDEEKIVLDHDALFVHAVGSCGGGFIYWKDEAFHWLQQE